MSAEHKEEEVAPVDENIDAEIAAMEEELGDLENEADAVKEAEEKVEENATTPAILEDGQYDTKEQDARSIYVGNVDYGATPEELQEHFKSCGPINRLTILVDRYTYSPKGYAYIEFQEESGVTNASLLNDSLFRGRQLKVDPKRTNQFGYNKQHGIKGKGKGKKGKGKPTWGGKGGGYMSYQPVWVPKGKGKKWGPY